MFTYKNFLFNMLLNNNNKGNARHHCIQFQSSDYLSRAGFTTTKPKIAAEGCAILSIIFVCQIPNDIG